MSNPNTSTSGSPGQCPEFNKLDPCTIVIFGASGDLTTRKLVPALFQMYLKKSLPHNFNIIGCARTPFSDAEYRTMLEGFVRSPDSDSKSASAWHDFAGHIHYLPLQYDDPTSFNDLRAYIKKVDVAGRTEGNIIFDLAMPPHLYPVISRMLGQAGLAAENQDGKGWVRIVIEKPFGHDLGSSRELQKILQQDFREEQIFRIDHYLAKETVQNILTFRFANAIFEPLWNSCYIDYVGIIAAEKLGVENRAGYYDQAGVIRDMFQNHMLQLLSLTAMEPPARFEAEYIRDEKFKVFRSLRQFTDRPGEDLILGQYGPGEIDGRKVAGYRQEKGVAINSLTATFAMMRLFVENWRWQGVPFYLLSGKRMQRKETRIVIGFKHVPHTMFKRVIEKNIAANQLILGIYPEEEIKLTFQAKRPGAKMCLNSMTMDFKYDESYQGPHLEAYEKVLLDCILGDHMLFWRQDGVDAAWSLLTPILHDCENCAGRSQLLHSYPAGSRGPEAATEWLDLLI